MERLGSLLCRWFDNDDWLSDSSEERWHNIYQRRIYQPISTDYQSRNPFWLFFFLFRISRNEWWDFSGIIESEDENDDEILEKKQTEWYESIQCFYAERENPIQEF